MKKVLPLVIFVVINLSVFSQGNSWSVKFSNAMISRYTPTIDALTGKGWEYSNAIILHGMEKVYKKVNTAAYRTYIKTFVDTYVNASGVVTGQTINSLDRLHPAILLLMLWEDPATSAADKTRYKTAADSARKFLIGPTSTYPKTSAANGSFYWHKNNGSYNDIMLLDGFYMAHPFLAKYGYLFNDAAATDTAVSQTLRIYNKLYDPATHSLRHAYNPTKTQPWAPASGNGVSSTVWSRAEGWYVMALVDILRYVPQAHPQRAQLLAALNNLAIGIQTYQDPASKLWYQVVDKTSASLAGNYIETSGSAMFVYALRVACDSNWISRTTYMPIAQSGWTGLQAKISTNADGMPQINDFAPAMGVQNTEALYVQASLQSVDCPGSTHPHGYAAILMAASAMEFGSTLPVSFSGFTAKEFATKNTLSWQMGDENDVDHYEIQKSTNGIDFTVIGTTLNKGVAKYDFDDNTIESKTVYYRINAVNRDGSSHYSMILSIKKNNRAQSFEISPNPVKGGDLNFVAANLKSGSYNIKIVSTAGHTVFTAPVKIGQEIDGQHIQLPGTIAKGVYYVQLTGEGITLNKNIVIE